MCIPIELDVPVVTLDHREIGIAREILCPCPGELSTGTSSLPATLDATPAQPDLWLRVTRSALRDLYVPFGEIAETRADGVRLRVPAADLDRRDWERPPVGLPILA
jgi:hypothetical protein